MVVLIKNNWINFVKTIAHKFAQNRIASTHKKRNEQQKKLARVSKIVRAKC